MDNSLDDDIELLNNTQDVFENHGDDLEGLNRLESGINPLAFISRGCSVDDSAHQGSLHALKTAFDALQKKHNVQSRKCADLSQKNRTLERKLARRLHGNVHDMDEPSEVHAAGGTSEDETALAVSRANQGYVQHLDRELLVTKAKLYRANEEANTLKNRLHESESKLENVTKERDSILSDIECRKDNFDLTKDAKLTVLNEKLESEKSINENLRLEVESLRQRLETVDRSTNSRDPEISNYQSAIATAKSELMKITMQYRELQKRVESLDKENSALKATCKQYEIEVEISRKQRRDQVDDVDDVDGDVEALNRALNLLSSQREEVCSLKNKIVQQSKIILQIQQNDKIMHLRSKSLSGLNSASLRQDPYGAVSSPRFEESYHLPHSQMIPTSRHAPLARRESDRSDYSTGRRVNDSIQPTGNKNITPMIAMESSPHVKRKEMHFHGNTLVPAIAPQNSVSQKPDLTGNHHVLAQSSHRSSTSPRSSDQGQGAYGAMFPEYSNLSPRLRQTVSPSSDPRSRQTVSPSSDPRSRQAVSPGNDPRSRQTASPGSDTGYSPGNDLGMYSGSTRQRVPNNGHNYMNMSNNDINIPQLSPQMQPNIPLRMTQSEIISTRDPKSKGEAGNIMSRSVFEPVQPLNIADTNGARSRFLLGEIGPGESQFNQMNLSEQMFRDQDKINGPDYENIYVAKPQTDRKRAVEHESEESTALINDTGVSDHRLSPPQATAVSERSRSPQHRYENADNVSVLNICPSCNQEFSRLTLDEFQVHVVNCFDSSDDQPVTLQAVGNDDDRTCPMCGAAFPLTIAQQTFEQHVLSHFGDDPGMERFEMLQ